MKNLLTTILAIAISFSSYCQRNASLSVSANANKSVSIDGVSVSSQSDVVYGVGVSFFYDKGNVGSDYTSFIRDFSSYYEQVLARNGSIYFLVGNKITNNFVCAFRFGLGVWARYYNGVGVTGNSSELWYVRHKGMNDVLCGISFKYTPGPFCVSVSWDSFNSFGAGIGINFNYR